MKFELKVISMQVILMLVYDIFEILLNPGPI